MSVGSGDERIRLILELVGRGQFKEAADEARQFTRDLREIGEAAKRAHPEVYELGSSAINTYDLVEEKAEAAARAAKEFVQVIIRNHAETKQYFSDLVEGAERAAMAQDVLSQHSARAGRSSRDMGMSILLASQFLDDLQYGVRAVVNNIPGLVMALGAGPGVAGAAGVAAVAFGLLTQHFDKLMGLFGESKTETEAERMERLADATKRTAEEEKQLAAFRERQKAKEQTEAQGGAAEKEAEDRVRSAIGIVGGPAASKAVADFLNREAAAQEAAAGGETPFTRATRDKNAANANVMIQRAQGQSGTPSQQRQARAAIEQMLAESPAFAATGFGQRIDSFVATPEEQAKTRERLRLEREREAAEQAKEAQRVSEAMGGVGISILVDEEKAADKRERDKKADEQAAERNREAAQAAQARELDQQIARDKRRAAGLLANDPLQGGGIADAIQGMGQDAAIDQLAAQLQGQGVQNARDTAMFMVFQVITLIKDKQIRDEQKWFEIQQQAMAMYGDIRTDFQTGGRQWMGR